MASIVFLDPPNYIRNVSRALAAHTFPTIQFAATRVRAAR